MRLWTLHPKYLDRLGLLGLWREGLLAQAVLEEKTKGYKNHPQLIRFKTHPEPNVAIGNYLLTVFREARRRGYSFDSTKINFSGAAIPIQATSGQLSFEVEHLLRKLEKRSKTDFAYLKTIRDVAPHPLFKIVPGAIESWEKVSR